MIDLSDYTDMIPDVYVPLLENEDRFLIMYGGAGSGKSCFAALKVIYRCITEPGITIGVVRKTLKSLRNSCYQEILKFINSMDFKELFPNSNKTDMTIECINGSKIIFLGLDDVEKIKSVVCDSFWVEEMIGKRGHSVTQNDFEQLNLRLRGGDFYKQIMITFNPINIFSWVKKYFFDRELESCKIVKTTYKDNPFVLIDEDYIRELEENKKRNPHKYEIYTLGNWGSPLTGLVFKDNVFEGTAPKGKIVKTVYGMDFGCTAPSTLIRCDFDKENNVYLTELIYKTEMTNEDIISELNRLKISKKLRIWGDHASPDRIKSIKRAGYNIKGCHKGKTVEEGIVFMQEKNLYTTINNKNLNEELQCYCWDEKDGEHIDKVIRENDHCIDSVRYAICSEQKAAKIRAIKRY